MANYDQESFLMGLAVGRMMWHPHTETTPIHKSAGFIVFYSAGSFTVGFANDQSRSQIWDGIIQYSFDRETWNTWQNGPTVPTLSSVNGKIYFRGVGNSIISAGVGTPGYDNVSYVHDQRFVITSSYPVYCDGNLEALLDYESVERGIHPAMGSRAFYGLFCNCRALVSSPKLPSVDLQEYCYAYMLKGTSIVEAPELPSMSLASGCYFAMMMRCDYLTTAPTLPATELKSTCYAGMFMGCLSLQNLAAQHDPYLYDKWMCYRSMYKNCPNIKVSRTQSDEYPYAFWVADNGLMSWNYTTEGMLAGTGGTYTGTTGYYYEPYNIVPGGTYYTDHPLS